MSILRRVYLRVSLARYEIVSRVARIQSREVMQMHLYAEKRVGMFCAIESLSLSLFLFKPIIESE